MQILAYENAHKNIEDVKTFSTVHQRDESKEKITLEKLSLRRFTTWKKVN